jgi:hypothetical protein
VKVITFRYNDYDGCCWPNWADRDPGETVDEFLTRIQGMSVPEGATDIRFVEATEVFPAEDIPPEWQEPQS